MFGVFADPEEVEECDEDEFSGRPGASVCGVSGAQVDVTWDCKGDGEFWLGRWVFVGVSIQKLLDGLWVPCFLCSQRALLSIQFDDRGDGGERHFDCLGANFVLVLVKAALSHMLGEGSQ